MKKELYFAMMRFSYKMVRRADKKFKKWCARYTEWGERLRKELGEE